MAENVQTIIDDTFNLLIKTYSPQPVVLDRGEGVYAYDTDGKKYIDFAAGIAVASLGHAHPVMIETLTRQAGRLMACQSSYATKEKLDCAKLLVDTSCMDYVYFSNSGTESVEACIKLARKWAYDNKGPECNEIIAFHKSFHGRTMGSASLTEKRFVQPYFGPYIPGIHFANFNDIESVKALVSDKTAMIIVEPVQGEGGLSPAEPDFLAGLREICDKHNIILAFDEVQAGFGRLGTLHAYQAFKPVVEPDIGAWAKGMGAGFPVGCMMVKKKYGEALQPGMHGTTYGGNPLACAVAAAVIREMLKPGFMENIAKTSAIMFDGLNKLKRESNKINEVKGMGLMIGVTSTIEIKTLLRALQKNGLMATEAGGGTLRLTPPLILTEDQAHEALGIIEKTLKDE
jgi:predicted acetylornithine/succinylornithine family transaminase